MKPLILIIALVLGGCDWLANSKPPDPIKPSPLVYELMQIEGHRYIVVDGAFEKKLIHAEHCACKGGGK